MQFRLFRRVLLRRPLLSFRYDYFQLRRQHDKARVVLLPEIPLDTAETNEFVRCVEDGGSLPDIRSWSLKDSINGTAKFGLEYEGWLLTHFEQELEEKTTKQKLDASTEASSSAASPSFTSLLDPIERNGVMVQYAWFTCRQHHAVQYYANENADSHIRGLQKLISRALYGQFSAESFHKALKELRDSGNVGNDPWHVRLLDNYLLECFLNGMELKAHKRYQLVQIRERIHAKKMDYKEHVKGSAIRLRDANVDTLNDLAADAPEHVLRLLSDNSSDPIRFPFKISYSPLKYSLYMRYCRRRMQRWVWWSGVNNRAAFREDVPLLNNSVVVEELRQMREREAKWLGHKTYVDLQFRLCMAKSVDEIGQFLEKFGDKAANQLDVLYEDMCNLAEAEGENTAKEPVEAWDLAYYAGQVAADKCKLTQHQFAEYFPYPQTLRRIFGELERIFGIEFRDVTESTPRWHPSVDVFQVQSAGGPTKGLLYIDPYMRKGKYPLPVTMEGRPKSDLAQSESIVYMNLALIPPKSDRPSLIYLDQLSEMAFRLGKALQYVLSSAPYSAMVGDRLVEWDCKDTVGRVLQLLVTGSPRFLVQISRHYQEDGRKLDLDTAGRFVKGGIAADLPSVVRQVVDSELDLSLYSGRRFWRDTYRDLHAKYLPYKWDKKKGDEFVCSFGGYVTESTASKYYSVLWSKMLASDIAAAFKEAEGEAGEQSLMDTGRRFSDLYLHNGGKYSQRETFDRFRGRQPVWEHMIDYYVSF